MQPILISFFLVIFLPEPLRSSPLRPQKPSVDCTDYKRKLDQWSNELFVITDRSRAIPKSESEMQEKYCTRSKEASNNLKRLRACLKPFPAQVLNVILSGVRKSIRSVCNLVESRQELVDRLACLQKSEIYDRVHDCSDLYTAQMEYVRDNVTNAEQKIPYTCCYFWKTRSCILNTVRQSCPMATLNYAERQISDLFSETTDLICSKLQPDSENCLKLPAIPVDFGAKMQSLNFVLPNLEIFTQT